MYTAEQNTDRLYGGDPDDWLILDPDGDWVCNVCGPLQAEALLSHLNRS